MATVNTTTGTDLTNSNDVAEKDKNGVVVDDDGDNDDDEYYSKLIKFQSIRNDVGLEEGISVQWQNSSKLVLSTLLQPTEIAPLFDGAQWAGTRVWNAAICAIQYISDHYSPTKSEGEQGWTSLSKPSISLLELGCGLGVPGMIAYESLGIDDVCLTDQKSIMSQLEKNIESNFTLVEEECKRKIQALPLDWSEKGGVQELLCQTNKSNTGYDIVLNCDCIYEPLYGKSWIDLVAVMDELLRVNPKTIMITSCERRTADGIDKFLSKLSECKHISKVKQVFDDSKYKIEIYVAHGIGT